MENNGEEGQYYQEENQNYDQNDEENEDEMDLTPYEEDDDATLHRKRVAAKLARKRVDEDMKLLKNRIGLLKMEENRAYKKIDQTRQKAGDIICQRKRNMNKENEK